MDKRGKYFTKKEYQKSDLPTFQESKDRLPSPVLGENSEWLDMYWKCWELAFDHLKKPEENSTFVSNFIDEAFNDKIFQWDTIFMIMFARYGHYVFPAINSLDNFYCRQHESGYICRELVEKDGSDFVFRGRKNTINPPLFSWAEVESFKNTGDKSRFEMVLPVLEKYVEWLNRDGDIESADDPDEWYKYGRRAGESVHKLFWNTGLGSGMDNTPRGGNGWVDMSSQMVIQYNNLAEMCHVLDLHDKGVYFETEARKIADRINRYCWNDEDGLYYDVDTTGNHVKWKTAGCFWPMLAGIASKEQQERLVSHLQDTSTFWRKNVFPTLAADQSLYKENGGYWLGGVWAPTNYAIIKGLESNGYEELAREASIRYVREMYCVYEKTGTVWENYAPDLCSPGDPAKPDFVGWSGIGPISLLIENILGFRVNGVEKSLTWHLTRTDKHGINNLNVGKTIVSAICEERESHNSPASISVMTDATLKLIVFYHDVERVYELAAGKHTIVIQ